MWVYNTPQFFTIIGPKSFFLCTPQMKISSKRNYKYVDHTNMYTWEFFFKIFWNFKICFLFISGSNRSRIQMTVLATGMLLNYVISWLYLLLPTATCCYFPCLFYLMFFSFSMMKPKHRENGLKTHLWDTRIILSAGHPIRRYILQDPVAAVSLYEILNFPYFSQNMLVQCPV